MPIWDIINWILRALVTWNEPFEIEADTDLPIDI